MRMRIVFVSMPEPMYTDFTDPVKLMQIRNENNDQSIRRGMLPSSTGAGATDTFDIYAESTNKIIALQKQEIDHA